MASEKWTKAAMPDLHGKRAIHPDWPIELQKRGVELINNVLRDEACAIYRDFGRSGTFVYNARLGT